MVFRQGRSLKIAFGSLDCPEINQGIAYFVASHIPGCTRGFESYTTMGVIKDDQLIAGVVYSNFFPETGVIELSAASTSRLWLTRPVLNAMFGYPFDQLGCQICVLRVSERNERMIRILHRFGFGSVRIPRLRGSDEAEIIFTLTDDAWRSSRFNPANRKVQAARTASRR
ncbi:GNAT family protein [Phyllobacterium sp. SB3]|uniref:GNAT family N-acetyltransferase n=1 Tax=Phyllobacterium sp. SB3 TaxID=3156073 RepID=UPI0032AEDA22